MNVTLLQAFEENSESHSRQKEDSSGKPQREHMVGRVALRTLFFDAKITAALEGKHGPKAKQVVLLGAGMDTRAWRLKMPAGILQCTLHARMAFADGDAYFMRAIPSNQSILVGALQVFPGLR